jgi:hypothetical protein
MTNLKISQTSDQKNPQEETKKADSIATAKTKKIVFNSPKREKKLKN